MPRTDTHESAGQQNQESATCTATHLADLLAARHNIPADVHVLPHGRVVVSVFAGLVARVNDHHIWWNVPDLTGKRTRPLIVYAHTAEAAAGRLAQIYTEMRAVPLADLLATGAIRPLAAALLDPTRRPHDAAPI